MSEPSERGQIGRTPIAGDSPVGQPAGDLAEFDELRGEATKDVAYQGEVDWQKVVNLGLGVVRDHSKDFVAASYLAAGLTHVDGFRGLADGLQILEGMIENHWEAGFPPVPKRLRARANAFAWMAERCGKRLEAIEPEASDRDSLETCNQVLASVDKLLEERMGDLDAQLGDLLRSLRGTKERLAVIAPPEPEPAPSAPAESAAPGSEGVPGAAPAQAAAPPPAAPAAAAPASSGEVKNVAEARLWLQRCSNYFREKDAASPIPFRLGRISRWGEILANPVADADGTLQALDPAPERLNGLRNVRDASNWTVLLTAAEEAFGERPLWLDAQRYIHEAAMGLGGAHEAVAQAVADELRSLLDRAPKLPTLRFKDGTPVADSDTREWIKQEVTAGGGGAAAIPTALAAEGSDAEAIEKARTEARQLAKKKKISEAISLIQDAMSGDPSPRNRFLTRLEIASLCTEAGQERLALPVLENLDEELRLHGLDRWEPGLATETLRALYRARRRMADRRGATPEASALAEEVFARLCHIDPLAAAALD